MAAKRKRLPIVVAIVGGSLIYFLSQARNLKDKFQVFFKDVTGLKLSGGALSFNLRLRLVNPTSAKLVIYSMAGTVGTQAQTWASMASTAPVTVGPNSEVVYTIPIQSSVADALSIVADIIANGKPSQLIYKGFLNTNFGALPFNDAFNLTL